MTDIVRKLALLSAGQRELLKARGVRLGASRSRVKPPIHHAQVVPQPSFGQERMWTVEQLEPGTARYNVSYTLRLRGSLDVGALVIALQQVVDRHEPMRSRYLKASDGTLKIEIAPHREISVPLIDLSRFEPAVRDKMLADAVALDVNHPFELDRDPATRQVIFRLAADDHTLHITTHHIAFDGWSVDVLLRDLSSFYNAGVTGIEPKLPSLPITFSDFANWQRDLMSGPEGDRLLSYWKQELEGSTFALPLPTDRPRPPAQTFRGAALPCAIPGPLVAAINDFCRQENVTVFMVVLAALYAVLARYTGQDDILVGSPGAARSILEVEDLIGFFTNTVLLRGRLGGNPTFLELLQRVRQTTLAARDHEDLPLQLVMEQISVERDLSRAALFQVMLVFQRAYDENHEFVGLQTTLQRRRADTSLFDLTFDLTPSDSAIEGAIEYNTALFDESTISRLWNHMISYLGRAIPAPHQKASSISLLPAAERSQLLDEFNATGRTYRRICIHQFFEEQVQRTPHATAVLDGERRLTYEELNARANQIAHHLIGLGAGPDVPIAIYCERGESLIAGILGILKSGSPYVPLDPAYPRERLECILYDSGAKILLTEQSLEQTIPPFERSKIFLDSQGAAIDLERTDNPTSTASSHDLAYILFTSGSTGKPKGVALEHRTGATLIQWVNETYTPEERAGILFSTSVCFDVSTFEIFVTLSAGGCIIVAPSLLHLPTLPTRDKVTLINAVPSAIAALLRVGGIPDSVRTINLAGEAVTEELVEEIYSSTRVTRVNNLYGPTESSYTTYTHLPRGARIRIGRPIANARLYVLDAEQNPVPIGVAGELYVAGDGVARGYVNSPALTRERFIPDRFCPELGRSLYKTGDLVRYLPDGNLLFLGRIDRQIKLRGYRIEPGEIESVLLEQPGISQAAVVLHEHSAGEKCLVAYLVGSKQGGADTIQSELHGSLRMRLPEYMIPSAYVFMAAFPLSPNGKTDLKALSVRPLPQISIGAVECKLPQNGIEQILLEIWCEVLKRDSIGTTENFFHIGGNSLSVMRVAARLPGALGIELPVSTLFQCPTIKSLAIAIEDYQSTLYTDDELLRMLDEIDAVGPADRGE